MKTIRNISKLIAVIALFAMVLSFASCKGSLKLESFTVDRSSVKTVYNIGDELDLRGIKATATYSDASLNKVYTYDELEINVPADVTATAGEKEITVSFNDPNLNVKQSTSFTITVKDNTFTGKKNLTGFAAPASITSFLAANNKAGTGSYTDGVSFSSVFAKPDMNYVIGDDNPFTFLPNAIVRGDNGPEQVTAFYSVVTLEIKKDGAYVALTAVDEGGNIVKFFDGETLIATVDTYNCSYQFTEDAVDSFIKISVLPSTEHYNFNSFPAITLEAKIIDAYNVFEAWQLAIISNDNPMWNNLRTEYGFADEKIAGVVLHNNIKVTAKDVPADFFRTTTQETIYHHATNENDVKVIPAGTKYLNDWSEIYRRTLANGESFVIEGNLFTIDASEFPLVASPGVFDLEGEDDDYGYGFSNATLIKIVSEFTENVDEYAKFEMNNLGIKGNASRNNYLDDGDNLVSAGGLIFFKALDSVNATINNTIGNSCFMSYFAEGDVIMSGSDVKCYDSYQTAILVWANSLVTFKDSYINGSGGPAIICSGLKGSAGYQQPIFIAENTVVDTSLKGVEIWFAATNSTTVVGQMQYINEQLLLANGFGSFVDANGMMNIKGLIMYDGARAEDILGQTGANGQLTLDGEGFTRLPDDLNWLKINGIWQFMPETQGAPFFTVQDADGNSHTLFTDTVGLYDLNGQAFAPSLDPDNPNDHTNTYLAFQNADTITLTMGGISVIFEFYH